MHVQARTRTQTNREVYLNYFEMAIIQSASKGRLSPISGTSPKTALWNLVCNPGSLPLLRFA
jgi:hypothetical protein